MFEAFVRSKKVVGRARAEVGVNPGAGDGRLDEVWGQWIRRHHRRVWVSVLALGVSPSDADEIVQKTWARLYEQHHCGALTHVRLPGLAIQQARFLVLEARRASAKHADLPTEGRPDPGPDPEAVVLDRERLRRANDALETCSTRAREIFRMVYDNPGLPHAVVAERFAISVQRVRQTLCEVRSTVRAALEEA